MSNTRKRAPRCAAPDCYGEAAVKATEVDNDGTPRGSRWLCRTHAVELTRRFGGVVWGDSQCRCGCVDNVIEDAGRRKRGDL